MATLVRDTFNRTSTTSPGSASTGQAWRAEQGTWGTDGTALYSVTAADNDQVTIDTGSQTQDITYTLAAGAGANKYPFTTARWSGIENFYVFRIEPDGSGSVEAWPAYARRGSLIPAGTFVNGNVIRFLVKEETTPTAGTRLTVWRNGTQVMNHLDSTAGRPAGTRMGFRHGSDSGVQDRKSVV